MVSNRYLGRTSAGDDDGGTRIYAPVNAIQGAYITNTENMMRFFQVAFGGCIILVRSQAILIATPSINMSQPLRFYRYINLTRLRLYLLLISFHRNVMISAYM
jgi:hypothetical protein